MLKRPRAAGQNAPRAPSSRARCHPRAPGGRSPAKPVATPRSARQWPQSARVRIHGDGGQRMGATDHGVADRDADPAGAEIEAEHGARPRSLCAGGRWLRIQAVRRTDVFRKPREIDAQQLPSLQAVALQAGVSEQH